MFFHQFEFKMMNSFLSAQANLSSINRMMEYIKGQANKKLWNLQTWELHTSLFLKSKWCAYEKDGDCKIEQRSLPK